MNINNIDGIDDIGDIDEIYHLGKVPSTINISRRGGTPNSPPTVKNHLTPLNVVILAYTAPRFGDIFSNPP